MKYRIILIIALFVISCNNPEKVIYKNTYITNDNTSYFITLYQDDANFRFSKNEITIETSKSFYLNHSDGDNIGNFYISKKFVK